MIAWISVSLMLLGAFFVVVSAIGIWRMPDFFTRLHPAGIGDGLGMPLVLMGALLHYDFGILSVKIILLMIVAMITAATASHALAKAAFFAKEKSLDKDLVSQKKGENNGKSKI